MSAALSKVDKNKDNSVNNSNNNKNGNSNVGGRKREEIVSIRGDYPNNILRLSVEAAAVRCTLEETLYALEKRWVS